MGALIDITGQEFGQLIVTGRAGSTIHKVATWFCKCNCGNTAVVDGCSLRKGLTRSCGCTHYDWLKANKIARTHGRSRTRLWRVWLGMKERCSNPNHNRYDIYGGRGIKVCPEWQEFMPFYEWAMDAGYDPEAPRGACTIDRIDADGDYCPENCRWVDMKIQNNHRRPRRKDAGIWK